MSKIKRSLPEDIDVTDVNDPGEYIKEWLVEMPSAADFALNRLHNSVRELAKDKHNITLGDLETMHEAIAILESLVEYVERPF